MARSVSCQWIYIVLLFLSVNTLHAQPNKDQQPEPKAWAKVGLGYSGANNYEGITGLFGGYYSSPYGILGFRYLTSDRSGSDPLSNARRIQRIQELSVSWGYSANVSVFDVSASAGIGSLWGDEQIAEREEQFAVLSVPLEAEIAVHPVPYVKIGTLFTTSINKKSRFSSALLVLQIGNFD